MEFLKKYTIIYWICLCIFSIGCKESSNQTVISTFNLSYNTQFKITDNLTISNFTNESIPFKKEGYKRIIPFSTAHFAFLEALESEQRIIGFPNKKYLSTSKNELEKIKELGDSHSVDIEEIIALKPDLVILYSAPNLLKLKKQLEQFHIKSIVIDEYKAQSPLAKSEWIKAFGFITDQQEKAIQLFSDIESNYNELKKSVSIVNKKTVLVGNLYGSVWYAPAPNSFMTQYLKDAGGDYVFKDIESKTASLQLSLEFVLKKAQNTAIWINVSNYEDLQTIANQNPKYKWFNAFKTKNVYNAIKGQSKFHNPLYQLGIVRCDWVLQDLIRVFQNESLDKTIFYQQLN